MADDEVPAGNLNDLGYLGVEIKEAREGRKLTQKHLGKATGYSESYVSKVEAGAVLPSEQFMCGCDKAFGTNGLFVRLRERVTKRGHASWFQPYVKLEREAVTILDYNASLVTGILQTPAYARAVIRAARPREADDLIQAKAEARYRRREILKRENPPLLWVVLHESTLRTMVGDTPSVMREQLEQLIQDAQTPNTIVQILPFGAGAPPAAESFTLLTFADRSRIVYADTLIGGQLTDAQESVDRATEVYDRLRAEAMPPAESLALMRKILEEYTL
ncbi:helix-turn-helix domain-containing protein [Streptomyces litchfieldiae]|uniref:Helix-turn-helix transcriptional regulator n=1 Tax=Streptomyces litchfieldiae TaxID=3075543 RepID=A0ABU2MSV8_9ACTN|nr:helix-turn-helix transcriptional regulator [Streptomyces sp. DSM 44938]MDT0344551.1 helix-turn-helix transcriptional regulator [Streptomyces sp. DSM 44938]